MSRKAFEEWAENNDKWEYDLRKLPFGHYADNKTAHACAGYQARQPEIDALKAEVERLKAAPAPDSYADKELLQIITERDQYHDWADKLADAIADRLGVEIGEHSNTNAPWQNALDAIEAPTPEVEPVAWRRTEQDVCDEYYTAYRDEDCPPVDEGWEALYTRPASDELRKASFQDRVQPWMMACFGPEISSDKIERNHRFLEESLELVQACGCTKDEAHQLVDYVYGRNVGEKEQEIGGVMVTLAALCLAHGLDMHEAGETELSRIWTMVEKIRAKQAAKPKHSPLPAALDKVKS